MLLFFPIFAPSKSDQIQFFMETINLQNVPNESQIKYHDENISLGQNPQDLRAINTPVMLDGYLILLILNGTAQVYVDDHVYDLQAGNILICHPRHILERSMTSMDIQVKSMFLNPDFLPQMRPILNAPGLNLNLLLGHHAAFFAKPHEIEQLSTYHSLLLSKLTHNENASYDQSIMMLMGSMFLEIYSICLRSNFTPATEEAGSSAEQIVKRFLVMLNMLPFLSVNYYAERLNITPKYFSSVCSKVTGKAPSQIIADEIISRSQVMLREGSHNIKQIADLLGFANQSHFGTFFRKHTGMSPQQFVKK